MPEEGNPFYAPELEDSKLIDALATDFSPEHSVRDWFQIRDSIHFTFQAQRSVKTRALLTHFGLWASAMITCETCGALIEAGASIFEDPIVIRCRGCGTEKTLRRRDFTTIYAGRRK